MRKNSTFILSMCLILIFVTVDVHADWQGPKEIIQAGWGSGENEFHDYSGDSHDLFPEFVDISADGHIVITDGLNCRFKIYDPSGKLIRNITPPLENPCEWVINPKFVASNVVLITKFIFFFSVDGRVIKSVQNKGNYADASASTPSYLYIKKREPVQWEVYSPSGVLVKTTSEQPLDLGKVDMHKIGTNNFKVTITYPDRVYTIALDRTYEKYLRDTLGRINAVSGKLVRKYNACGKELGSLLISERQSRVVRPSRGGFDERESLIADFGVPIVAPIGDVYTWKGTPSAYSILKWTWIDDPKTLKEPCVENEFK